MQKEFKSLKLYHGTKLFFLDDIIKNGLNSNKKSNSIRIYELAYTILNEMVKISKNNNSSIISMLDSELKNISDYKRDDAYRIKRLAIAHKPEEFGEETNTTMRYEGTYLTTSKKRSEIYASDTPEKLLYFFKLDELSRKMGIKINYSDTEINLLQKIDEIKNSPPRVLQINKIPEKLFIEGSGREFKLENQEFPDEEISVYFFGTIQSKDFEIIEP